MYTYAHIHTHTPTYKEQTVAQHEGPTRAYPIATGYKMMVNSK